MFRHESEECIIKPGMIRNGFVAASSSGYFSFWGVRDIKAVDSIF